MDKKIVLNSFLNALGTVVYVALVVLLLNSANKLLGPDRPPFTGIAALLLLILSASITGSLVLGRPVMWYLNGQKSEAVKLFISTLLWLLAFTVIFFILLATILK